jgi:hypothetical protein
MKLSGGAGPPPAGFSDALGLPAILEGQAGSIEDQELVGRKLAEVFKSR